MSDGTLWKIVGDRVTPRPLNANIFGTARSMPAPQTMASTPEGGFVLILAGNGTAFLYSSADDDFVAARSVIPAPITGYYGPIAAGPERAVFPGERPGAEPGADARSALPAPARSAAADCLLRAAHVQGRPVAAVAAVGASSLRALQHSGDCRRRGARRYRAGGSGGCQHLAHHRDRRGARNHSARCRAGARVNVAGRSMVLDSAGTTAFVLTASGISVIPLETAASGTSPRYAPMAW